MVHFNERNAAIRANRHTRCDYDLDCTFAGRPITRGGLIVYAVLADDIHRARDCPNLRNVARSVPSCVFASLRPRYVDAFVFVYAFVYACVYGTFLPRKQREFSTIYFFLTQNA